MSRKLKVKIGIDLLMTVLLLILMAYHLTGQLVHEWLGTAMAVLTVIHIVLNGPWVVKLFSGSYTINRTVQTAINIIILLAFIGLMVSGVMLSRHVFTFLSISSGRSFARSLHHISAYWAFIGTSMHLGLHWNMIMGMVRKVFRVDTRNGFRTGILRVMALIIAVIGGYAFVKHQMGKYMLNLIQYAFFDYGQPPVLFFLENTCVVGLFAIFMHYLGLLLRKSQKPDAKKRGGMPI